MAAAPVDPGDARIGEHSRPVRDLSPQRAIHAAVAVRVVQDHRHERSAVARDEAPQVGPELGRHSRLAAAMDDDRVEPLAEIVLRVEEELAARRLVVNGRVVDLAARVDPEIAQQRRALARGDQREGHYRERRGDDEPLLCSHVGESGDSTTNMSELAVLCQYDANDRQQCGNGPASRAPLAAPARVVASPRPSEKRMSSASSLREAEARHSFRWPAACSTLALRPREATCARAHGTRRSSEPSAGACGRCGRRRPGRASSARGRGR